MNKPADWNGALEALREAKVVALACHVNPDGDALGALLGMSLALRKMGKTTHPTWGTPTATVPYNYAFLPGADSVVKPGSLGEVDLFIAVDCGDDSRLGSVKDAFKKAPRSINIDHHPGNDDFATLNIVITDASSTAEIVTRMLEDLGTPFDRDIATCLYTGIVTDTGRFQYANSSPEVLRLAADLLARGVPATAIAQEVYESAPFGYLKLTGHVLERAKLLADHGFVYSWFTRKDLKDTNVSSEETEKLIDLVRSTRDADIAAMFKEQSDGTYRVSLRSKGPRSVGTIARANGGGGHELAAGFTAKSVEDAVKAVIEGLSAQVQG
ncbi:MAG: bifunctional oligoribonuclease/PAP phosphatase NrnA [Actinobacteria bacterium]|nr:bifunctional oligoribonuclease/PAP phosphatase NrnA [Actinomycetota bacterium]